MVGTAAHDRRLAHLAGVFGQAVAAVLLTALIVTFATVAVLA
jgi:hypothetical protein